VTRVMRELFDEAGFPWATPHTLRRTVASLLDEAGQPIALAANVLGHKDAAMTARVYLNRRGDTSAAAAVL
jgi:integrase